MFDHWGIIFLSWNPNINNGFWARVALRIIWAQPKEKTLSVTRAYSSTVAHWEQVEGFQRLPGILFGAFGGGFSFRNQEKGVFRRGFLQHFRLSWLWRSECHMYCWGPYPRVVLVSLAVTLDSTETPFAKTPFSWFLNHMGLMWDGIRAESCFEITSSEGRTRWVMLSPSSEGIR